MADDIFLTPEEQDERAKKWLRENGPAIAIRIVLGLGGIYGYDEYRKHQQSQAEEASYAYGQILEVIQESDLTDITSQVETLTADYAGTPFASKAMLLKAKQLSLTDVDAAIEALDWVLENAEEQPVWHAANIRRAKMLLSKEGQAQSVIASLEKVDHEGYASHYLEVVGDAYVQLGEDEQAVASYQAAIDALTPADAGYTRILTLKQNGVRRAESNADNESS